jgi:hypothetical protein
MVTMSDAFPSKYLKAADLPAPVVATIKVASLEKIKSFSGGETDKVVIFFAKGLKPLPLNRTNFESCVDISGSDDSDDFVGTKVELYATKTSMNGKTMDCVRIRAPGAEEKPRKPVTDDGVKPDYNDEIPL